MRKHYPDWLGRLVRDRRGTHAVETAIVLPALLVVLFGCIQFGLTLFSQSILDNAAYVASRQIMVGSLQQSGGGEGAFTQAVCSQLQLMSCSSLQVDVQSASSFGALTPAAAGANGALATTGFSPGGPGSDVLVQVAYPEPCLAPLVCNFFGSNASVLLISTVSFQNENY